MKWLKKFTWIFFLPILATVGWYSIFFLPYVDDISIIVEAGKKDVIDVEADIYKLAVIAEGKNGIRGYAIKRAYRSLAQNNKSKKMIDWHLNTIFLTDFFIRTCFLRINRNN